MSGNVNGSFILDNVLSSCLFFIIGFFKAFGVLYLLKASRVCRAFLKCV